MGWGDSALFMKISLILLIVTLIIQILGVALPYWYSLSVNNGDFYGGLWRNCGENDATNYKACSSPTNVTDWFEAVRAFEIIGLLLLVVNVVLVIVIMFVNSDKTIKLVNFIIAFCACGFILIGIIIYGAEAEGYLAEYSGAFALCIIAGILALVAGILCLMDWMGKGK